MQVIKYKNTKRGGMPVTFPVGCKSKSAVTHHKVANPYLELTDEEATILVDLDPHNFEMADPKEYSAWLKGQGRGVSHVVDPTASLTDEELEAALAARKKMKGPRKIVPKDPPKAKAPVAAVPKPKAKAARKAKPKPPSVPVEPAGAPDSDETPPEAA